MPARLTSIFKVEARVVDRWISIILLQIFREFVISLSTSGTDTHTPLPLININNQYSINIKRMIIIESVKCCYIFWSNNKFSSTSSGSLHPPYHSICFCNDTDYCPLQNTWQQCWGTSRISMTYFHTFIILCGNLLMG